MVVFFFLDDYACMCLLVEMSDVVYVVFVDGFQKTHFAWKLKLEGLLICGCLVTTATVACSDILLDLPALASFACSSCSWIFTALAQVYLLIYNRTWTTIHDQITHSYNMYVGSIYIASALLARILHQHTWRLGVQDGQEFTVPRKCFSTFTANTFSNSLDLTLTGKGFEFSLRSVPTTVVVSDGSGSLELMTSLQVSDQHCSLMFIEEWAAWGAESQKSRRSLTHAAPGPWQYFLLHLSVVLAC